tara:strand:- start:2070 stop:3452 length:1383 start_codon:yes stop_codon:yes gene_type:complete
MSEVFAESLNYKSTKSRAVAARSFRTKVASSNSTKFVDGETVNIDLAGNMPGTYYNFNQMYLKFKVKNANSAVVNLDRCGAAAFIKRIQISQSGAQLFDLNNWNVLYTALLDTDASPQWKASTGNILQGTRGDSLTGESITDGEDRVFCVPMVLTPLSNTTPHRLIPAFSLAALNFKIQLENATTAVSGTAVANGKLEFSDIEMVSLMTQLSPGAQARVDQMNGGVYNILATSYMNAGANVASGVTSVTANLGISVSSLERIIMIQRPQSTLTAIGAYSIGNRAVNGLTRYQYQINSESYPAVPIDVSDKGAEVWAELMISNHSLVNFRDGCSIQKGIVKSATHLLVNDMDGSAPETARANPFMEDEPAGTSAGASNATPADCTPSSIGTFLASVEFETGLSDGKSATIYSGLSTISSVVQFVAQYSGGAKADAQLDFFAHFTVLMSLDTRGQGIWTISV